MIVFEVQLNGKRVVRAGLPGYAVLNTIVGWVNRRPRPGLVPEGGELSLRVGGLESNGQSWEDGTHAHWNVPEVSVGDSIRIRIIESENADPPATTHRTASKAELDADRKRSAKHYLALYRQQRRQLDRQIHHLERELKRLRAKATTDCPPTRP